jgi:hypothetical protein
LRKRVVVTGLGIISPVGTGIEQFWTALTNGVSGIRRITRFDAANFSTQIAGEVVDFDPMQYIDRKEARRMDRFTQFAVAGAGMAIEDAGLALEAVDRERVGVILGSGIGDNVGAGAAVTAAEYRHPILIDQFFGSGSGNILFALVVFKDQLDFLAVYRSFTGSLQLLIGHFKGVLFHCAEHSFTAGQGQYYPYLDRIPAIAAATAEQHGQAGNQRDSQYKPLSLFQTQNLLMNINKL